MDNHAKKIKFNLISTVLCQIITIAIGFVLPMLYIENFGSETNGVLSVIRQIFTYLCLLEAGIGLASMQALYKPVAEKDRDAVNGILAATKYFYRRTGVIYTVCVSAVAVGYAVYVYFAGLAISPFTVFALVMLNAVPSMVNFFLQQKYQVLLETDGMQYVITGSQTILQIVSGFVKIAVILLTKSLILMQASYALCAVIQLLCVTVYARKRYPWLNFKVPRSTVAVAQKNSVFVHQISAMVFNNTDIILLSFLCSPIVGSIYYVYNLFFSQVETFFFNLLKGFSFSLGQLYAVDKEKFKSEFDLFELGTVTVSSIIYTLMCVFLLPIIRIYTQNADYASAYLVPTLVILFAVSKLISTAKQPLNQVIEYCGAFKETRWHALVEMTVNIITTVICILVFNNLWGTPGALCGALLGTIAASLFRNTVLVFYVNRKVLNRKISSSYLCFLANGLVFALVFLLFRTDAFADLSFWDLCLKGLLYAPLIVLAHLISNAVFQPKKCMRLFTLVKGKLTKHHG